MVHWKLTYNTKVSYELLLSVDVSHEVHEGQEIVKILLRTVGAEEIDVNIEPFEETTHKMVTLEVKEGEIMLAPEKVRSGRILVLHVFSSFLTRVHCRRSLLSAARPNVHDHEGRGLLRR